MISYLKSILIFIGINCIVLDNDSESSDEDISCSGSEYEESSESSSEEESFILNSTVEEEHSPQKVKKNKKSKNNRLQKDIDMVRKKCL